MKKVCIATLLATALFAVSAFAGEKNITLTDPTYINGQKLAAGDYKMKYEMDGSTAEVKFLKGKKEVMSTSAQVVDLNVAPQHDALVKGSEQDGTPKLVEVQFARQKSAIRFGSESAQGR